jgi:hypothetical protein
VSNLPKPKPRCAVTIPPVHVAKYYDFDKDFLVKLVPV